MKRHIGILFLEMSSGETRPSLFSRWEKTVTVTKKRHSLTRACIRTLRRVVWGIQTVTVGRCLYVAGDNWHTLFLRRRMPADSTSGTTGCSTLGERSFHWDWPFRRWSHSLLRLLWLINDSIRKAVLSNLQMEAMRWFQKWVNPRNAILEFLMLLDHWRVRGVRGLSMIHRYLW